MNHRQTPMILEKALPSSVNNYSLLEKWLVASYWP